MSRQKSGIHEHEKKFLSFPTFFRAQKWENGQSILAKDKLVRLRNDIEVRQMVIVTEIPLEMVDGFKAIVASVPGLMGITLQDQPQNSITIQRYE